MAIQLEGVHSSNLFFRKIRLILTFFQKISKKIDKSFLDKIATIEHVDNKIFIHPVTILAAQYTATSLRLRYACIFVTLFPPVGQNRLLDE
jgi:hypothetical protein